MSLSSATSNFMIPASFLIKDTAHVLIATILFLPCSLLFITAFVLRGRGLIDCKNCVVTEENSLGWYVKNHVEPLLVAVKSCNTIPASAESVKPEEFKNRKQNERIIAWKSKAMHDQ